MLADYCLPGADPDLQEPLATRLLGLLEHFGGRLMIRSGRRSRGEQQKLYDAWVAGEGNYAAVPGFSAHERGAAADLAVFDGLKWPLVHAEADIRGLRFPIVDPYEPWHIEASLVWVAPEPEEWDMTDDDMRKLAGYVAAATVEALMKHDVVLSDGKAHKVENIIGYGNNNGNDTVSLLRTISSK
jgi:hypothetical protein